MRLAIENRTAWSIYTEALPLLFDGVGGVNAGIIGHFLHSHAITGWRVRDTLIKLAAIVAVMKEKEGES